MQGRQDGRKIRSGLALACATCASLLVHGGARAETAYLTLDAIGDPEIAEALKAALNLPEIESATAGEASTAAIDTERNRLAALLRAFGYLDARTEIIRPVSTPGETAASPDAGPGRSIKPFEIELRPIPGEPYRIGTIQIAGLGGDGLASLRSDLRDLVRAFIGTVARSDTLSRLEDEITWRVRSNSHPYAKVTNRDVVPDPTFMTAAVRIAIDAGPATWFGAVTYYGLTRIDERSLAAYVPFSPGDPYRPEVLIAFVDILRGLPIFRTVNVHLADAPDANGLVGIKVAVRETPVDPEKLAQSRSIGLAALGSVLAAVAFRQVALASGVPARSRRIRMLTVLILLLFAASAWFVVERLLVFANIG